MTKQRRSLAGMLNPPAEAPPLPARPADVQTPGVQTPGGVSATARTVARTVARRTVTPEVQTPGLPKYKRLERKEALMWPDDVTALSIMARRLNKTRASEGERITANTLIRVAVALLLGRSQELAGSTEEELRRSLGLPDLQTL